MKKIKIQIQNCSDDRMSISKEPEAIQAFINVRDMIEVETNAEEEDNILINVGKNDDGTIYIQIWDALNTRYIIYHKGKNMFEEYL
ncbi:MAG: filamentous hemagglutinin family outer membrane protein [Mucilaginibacter sp.]|nr:filamentous hemagglutinin family outer membrane protein [Mucilaginibacter sp.]